MASDRQHREGRPQPPHQHHLALGLAEARRQTEKNRIGIESKPNRNRTITLNRYRYRKRIIKPLPRGCGFVRSMWRGTNDCGVNEPDRSARRASHNLNRTIMAVK